MAESVSQLQRLGLYEKCPYEKDDQDHEKTIFDKGESIKVAVNPESFAPPDLNIILSVTNEASANANHDLDKDTYVLDDVTYVIDDGHPIKPQIYLIPQHLKRMQLRYQSLVIIIHKLRKDNVCSTALLNTYFLGDKSVLYERWSTHMQGHGSTKDTMTVSAHHNA